MQISGIILTPLATLKIWGTAVSLWEAFWLLLSTHLIAVIGFSLALIITAKMINEKRTPSNIFAWSLLIFFVPYVGVPLYLLFGGRKCQKLVAHKKRILKAAADLAGQPISADLPAEPGAKTILQRKTKGNCFELYADGQKAFDAMLEQIRRAKESIHIMTYIIGKDETGTEIVKALAQRAKEGIEVRLLLDGLGSFGATRKFVQPIRAAGGKVSSFLPMLPVQTTTSSNLRNHRKVAIFDKKRAIVGGQNLDTRFMGPTENPNRFRDFSALIEGPVVAALNRMFVSDWCFASGKKPKQFEDVLAYTPPASKEDNEVEIISSGPDVEGDPLWERIITLVQQAQRSLTIVTPYFIPDEVLFRSLIVKAHSGIKVRMILPQKSNQRMVDFARGHYLRKLEESGVEILMYQPGMVHAKLFIADGKTAMIGSANLDIRSLFVNFEIGAFITSAEPVDALKKWIKNISKDCLPYEETKQAKSSKNRKLMEDFAHLLVPLL